MIVRPESWPDWFDGKTINEALFCRLFLLGNRIAHTEHSFFTPEGKLTDENDLRTQILTLLEPFVRAGVTKKIDNIVSLLRIKAHVDDLLPKADRIHLANGTLFPDGRFTETKEEIVRCRLPVRYNPQAEKPTLWLRFLDDLLYPEDIPTLQEFIGYCLIPTNAGQRMMVIKGNGGEGKSQIGAVLSRMFGAYAKDGSVGKISENQFARADLEHCLLMIDDDMRLEALRQTNYVKSIVTAKGKMDLERKGKQSYQGWMYARILAFSNGDLVSLFDRSEGFFRRQLILTTKGKPPERREDPDIAEKMCGEMEGILLWAFEGLQRLIRNQFRFTESERVLHNRELVRRDTNNILLFMDSEGYICRGEDLCISSEELRLIYRTWCEENAYVPVKSKIIIEYLVANQEKFGVIYTHHLRNAAGRQVRGFRGIGAMFHPSPGWSRTDFSGER
ncbi:MAG: DNA primase [Clostridia bacterium]|nr:DNA primase [Clostridia bacterium]